MSYVFELSKLLKISKKSFVESLSSFSGLPHRYEIFSKRKIVLLLMTQKQRLFSHKICFGKFKKHFLDSWRFAKKMTKLF